MIRAAVLGSPIAHSLSPILHRRAYEYLGIEGEYFALDVKIHELSDFIANLDQTWSGFSLTMPLKEEVLKYCEDVEPLALRIASANTLIRGERGWRALTTDVNGFRSALASHAVHDFTRVAILGSGATARAAAAAVDATGREIFVLHRSSHREVGMRAAAPSSELHFLGWDAALPEVDLLINTTPHGVVDQLLARPTWVVSGVLFEALYDPWPSPLLAQWLARDLPALDGLDLLVHQGIDQVALMTHSAIIREDMAPILRQAGLDELNRRSSSRA